MQNAQLYCAQYCPSDRKDFSNAARFSLHKRQLNIKMWRNFRRIVYNTFVGIILYLFLLYFWLFLVHAVEINMQTGDVNRTDDVLSLSLSHVNSY